MTANAKATGGLRAAGAAAAVLCVLAAAAVSLAGGKAAQQVAEHAEKIAEIHELPLKGPVDYMILPKDKLLARIKELVFIDYTKRKIIDEGRMMVRLGLFPAGVDYERTIFDLLEEQVLGLYDTCNRELLLTDRLPGIMEDTTIDHEITHAVQDQNFDLKYLMKRRRGEGDMKYAVSAVFEGDALLMEEALTGESLPGSLSPEGLENLMMALSGKTSKVYKVPAIIRKALFFPYSYGYVFMRDVLEDGGYPAVNAVLADPPESTEQIMHPGSYYSDDRPEKVTLDLPPKARALYRVAVEDVMGEFTIKAWLEEFLDPVKASLAADGWEGDWFTFLWPKSTEVGEKHLQRGVFVMLSKWEGGMPGTHLHAVEFFEGMDELVETRWKPEPETDEESLKIYRNVFDEWLVIRREGDTVLYVEGLPASAFPRPEQFAADSM